MYKLVVKLKVNLLMMTFIQGPFQGPWVTWLQSISADGPVEITVPYQ